MKLRSKSSLLLLAALPCGWIWSVKARRDPSSEMKAHTVKNGILPGGIGDRIEWRELEGTEISGRKQTLSHLFGQDVLVYFSCGCLPCEDKDPNAAGRFLSARGQALFKDVLIVSVVKESQKDALRLKLEGKLPGSLLLDTNGRITDRFGVKTCPYAIAVNRDGQILSRSSMDGPPEREAWSLASFFSPSSD
jgi:hypothetical protein